VTLTLRLAYGSVDEFLERYALNISRGGIFIRTLDPRPVGSEVWFAVDLASGERVIHGKGLIRWSTPPSAPGEPARTPGMGIKFLELDPQSRALVQLLVSTSGQGALDDEPPRPREGETGGPPPEEVLELQIDSGEPATNSSSASQPGSGSPAAPPLAAETSPRRAPSRKPKRIGIDLGTTNSCVAIAEGGKARVLASRQGQHTIPSVVAFDSHGRLLVGHPAKRQMVVNPRHTVYGSKRLVGRPFASPTVQACRDRFHYEIVEGPDGAAAVRFAGRDFSLQQIAAFVLAEMRATASEALGEDVTRAVVTVPAYYNDHQRNAVREAGQLAGLTVERIVNEPTAAALAFGYGRGLDKRVLVYDLGGGTFDASVLEIQGDVYEVVSTGGDTFLGGVDFDSQLGDHLVYRFMERHGFVPPADRVVWQRIRDAAEETKVALSSREVAVAHVPYLCKGPDGKEVDMQVDVSRLDLEYLTEQLVDRTIAVCQEVLAAKELTPGQIDEVLLVGGQSRMPLVWRKIREAFGREPNKSVHPDEAVAIGAALLADSEARIDSVVLIDVLAMGIGVGLPGGRMAPVLARNTKLPAKKSYELSTTKDGQPDLELAVFQGDSQKASECEYLGTMRVEDLPPRRRGEVRVSVEFSLGAEGILHVTAKNLSTGRVTDMRLATRDTPSSLREKLQIPEPQTAPKGARPIDAHLRAASAPAGGEKKGLFKRIFGRK
jgi:molecular chaperone DnaK